MNNLFNYIDRPSPIHRLTGATKFIVLLLWSFGSMFTYDTRFLIALVVVSFILLKVAKIKWKDISFMMGFTSVFLIMSMILQYVFSPHHGTEIYGTTTFVFSSFQGKYALTYEQLFYQFNYLLKYLVTIPIVLLFVCTTNPSEFASSLNKVGVKYSIAYSVAIALRYIPDIQKEYHEISQAQQARGIEMSKKASIIKRLKSASAILIPLIMTSMSRIDIISNAMELRGFGKNKKRTWYMAKPFRVADYLSMVYGAAIVGIAVFLWYLNGGRYYNPFI